MPEIETINKVCSKDLECFRWCFFSASAHDFGIWASKFSLVAIINWHLNYKGPKCIEFLEGQNQESDPLVLAEGLTGLNLNHNIVVLDPIELEEFHDDGGQFQIFST